MFRYQILIEYVGTPFVGWQIQKKGKSIQKTIQSSLSKLLKQKIILYSAGRTDREVHANGQSAHFDVENKIQNIDKMIKSLNFFLNPKKISIINKPLSECNIDELKTVGIINNSNSIINFINGVKISGKIKDIYFYNNKPLIIKLNKCKVIFKNQLLFYPEWGDYDLVCGENVISVFGGPADYNKYFSNLSNDSLNYKQSSNLTNDNKNLNKL